MEKLKKIEAGIVPVYETNTGEKVVYGTELHEALNVKSNYREWAKRRFKDIDAVESEDFEPVEISTPSGQSKLEHIIGLDIAKEMAMLERNQKGKQVRRYFIQLEKKYKAVQVSAMARIEEMALRISNLEKMLSVSGNGKCFGNPFMLENSNFSTNLKHLNYLTGRVAELYGISKTRTLHYLYLAVGNQMGASIDSYIAVYRAETGCEDISPLNIIAGNEKLYKKAVEMSEQVIERKTMFG